MVTPGARPLQDFAQQAERRPWLFAGHQIATQSHLTMATARHKRFMPNMIQTHSMPQRQAQRLRQLLHLQKRATPLTDSSLAQAQMHIRLIIQSQIQMVHMAQRVELGLVLQDQRLKQTTRLTAIISSKKAQSSRLL